ncbi:membrane associated rhomboid family serine protease [Actinoalloteichus hoggarensis]|nr:rhomboid family intramembrane serine protease [Actinoalloteichus hoggarensis]MBB5920083.1 membrane associated rhomboid family serine protease [Actinoalloteichus hoggarensis]
MDSLAHAKPPRPPAKRVLPPQPKQAAIVMVGFTATLWVVHLINVLLSTPMSPGGLNIHGIRPLDFSGLAGVLWAPFLHGDWAHLMGNSVPFLIFGFLAMSGGVGQWLAVTSLIWLVGGMGVWVAGGIGTLHIGASGVVFGWLTFLLVRGLFSRSLPQIGVAIVLFFFYGGILWGVLPGQPGVSWQGHLFGALGGALAAWLVAKSLASRQSRPSLTPGLS